MIDIPLQPIGTEDLVRSERLANYIRLQRLLYDVMQDARSSGASEGLKTTKGSSTDDQGVVHIALGCQWSTISSAQNRGKWHDITRDVKFVYNSKSTFVFLNPILNRISTPPPPKKKKKKIFFFFKVGKFFETPPNKFLARSENKFFLRAKS